jgi:hypothetical protein
MTHIKQLIGLAFLLVVLSTAAKAQSTALFPFEGATHTYGWNGLTNGDLYAFYLTADAAGNVRLDDAVAGEFDFLDTTTGTVAANRAAVPLAWNLGASNNIYYLWIEVRNSGGCINNTFVRITPQVNQFDLLSENIPVDNTISCPAVNTADGFNPLAAGYDAGTTTLQFKVRRTGGNRNWKFEPVLTIDPTWNLDIAVLSIVGANSGTLVADASNVYTVNALDDEVLVTVSVKNQPGNTQVVSFEVRNQSEADTNLLDSNSSNDKVTHTIQIMPVINSMGGA